MTFSSALCELITSCPGQRSFSDLTAYWLLAQLVQYLVGNCNCPPFHVGQFINRYHLYCYAVTQRAFICLVQQIALLRYGCNDTKEQIFAWSNQLLYY